MNAPAQHIATARPLHVLQVDPSLFTAPYDAALSQGLGANAIDVRWATRRLRPGEEDLLPGPRENFFYPLTDGPRRKTGKGWKLLKGLEHGLGLVRLADLAGRSDVDLVHFQWALVPRLDRYAIRRIRRRCPVVLTVHDTTPLNGARTRGAQVAGFDELLRSVDALIVHIDSGRDALIARGVPADRIHVVPHGRLALPFAAPEQRAPGRWRIVLFGRLQDYKGVDLAIEALGRTAAGARAQIELVIAGEPMIDVDPLVQRIAELGIGGSVDLRPRRLGELEMAALLRSADAFIFPYRTIEASGVLHLVADLDRWIVASDLGCFRELVDGHPGAGRLLPPGDVDALAAAMEDSIGRAPDPAPASDVPGWDAIGARTRQVYEAALRVWRG